MSSKNRAASPKPTAAAAAASAEKKNGDKIQVAPVAEDVAKEDPKKSEKKQQGRQSDALDVVIDKLTTSGTLALLAVFAGVCIQFRGQPADWGLSICAVFMGLGKGGVPGASTISSAVFALLAPAGLVNKMMALVVPITLMSDLLVGVLYFRDARWDIALKISLFSGVGTGLGMQINKLMTDDLVRQAIGVVFLAAMAWHAYEKHQKSKDPAYAKKSAENLNSNTALACVGIVGGIASYITNQMGPLLNIYLLALGLPTYAMVGTRAATFMTVNFTKCGMRWHAGDIDSEAALYGISLGCCACLGVVLAKTWLKKVDVAFFSWLYEKVTVYLVTLTGALLICGWDFKSLVKFIWEKASPLLR